jgi:hypothetical protein
MHFNENANREQAVTAEGELRYAVSFTKAKKGEPSVKVIKPAATFGKLRLNCILYWTFL